MSKRSLYAFIVSFLLLVAVIVLNRISFGAVRKFSGEVEHTRMVITQLESVSNHFKSAQIYSKYFADSTRSPFYALCLEESLKINSELDSLRKLVSDNPVQYHLIDSLTPRIRGEMKVLMDRNIVEIIRIGEIQRLDTYLGIHKTINRAIANEEALLVERKARLNESTHQNNLLSTILAVLAVSIVFFTFFSNFLLSKHRRWLQGFLESILNTSQNGIVHYKAVREEGKIVDFRLEFVNKAIDGLLGIDSEAVTGKRLSEISSYVMASGLFARYAEVVDTGRPAEFETLYKRAGREKWLLVALAKLDDGLTASFQDITQLKRYEEELKGKIQDLQRSNAELEQYAYVASHDLQEPLRKIRSFGSYLLETQASRLDERGRQQIDKILSSAERMSILIKDILSFSSMDKQGHMESTDLNVVIKNVLQDLDLLIQQKGARIETDPLPTIRAIPLQMHQLFYNLINNSLKFGREGVPLFIEVRCRLLPEADKPTSLQAGLPYYEILVRDNGIGFSAEYEEQIFGLFKRLNDKQFYPGSGIGLALCKKVVDNHQGEILARGRENEGASFYIYLPKGPGNESSSR